MIDQLFAAVVAFAVTRHAVVTRAELHTLGVSDRIIVRWLADGLLHRVHRGVYAVGRPDLTANGHRLAAVRSISCSAAVSHGSAGALWEITNTSLFPVHVIAPGSGRPQRPGIRIHRTTTMHADDVTTLHSIPVTSVARTCLDHAAARHNTLARLVTVLEDAERNRIFDLRAFSATLARNPHHRGAPTLRAAVAMLAEAEEPPDLRSRFERDFRELIADRPDIPRPLFNATVAGHMVDVWWRDWALVVELKSRRFHLNPTAFETDPVRDADLQRAGQRVLQVTWRRLTEETDALVADILGFARPR